MYITVLVLAYQLFGLFIMLKNPDHMVMTFSTLFLTNFSDDGSGIRSMPLHAYATVAGTPG